MKQLLMIVLLIGGQLYGMNRMNGAINNTSRNFGKTHFIVGYKAEPAIEKTVKRITVDHIPLIKSGSSVHLIDESREVQSFFTIVHNVSSIVLDVLAKAQKSIRVAAFALTDPDITKRLIDAHKKGIDVLVIMDSGNMDKPYSKAKKLIKNGIKVLRYDPTLSANYIKQPYMPYMHRKCCIIDEGIVITGSANLTRAGLNRNAEDINIIRCPRSVAEHCTQFECLKESCVKSVLPATS